VYITKNASPRTVLINQQAFTVDGTVVVDQQVVDVDTSIPNYILVLRKVAMSADCKTDRGQPTIVTHYTDESQYFIIDKLRREEFGPMDASAFKAQLKERHIPDVRLTVPAAYHSNSEAFSGYSCRSDPS
jgi:hypothetical protein